MAREQRHGDPVPSESREDTLRRALAEQHEVQEATGASATRDPSVRRGLDRTLALVTAGSLVVGLVVGLVVWAAGGSAGMAVGLGLATVVVAGVLGGYPVLAIEDGRIQRRAPRSARPGASPDEAPPGGLEEALAARTPRDEAARNRHPDIYGGTTGGEARDRPQA